MEQKRKLAHSISLPADLSMLSQSRAFISKSLSHLQRSTLIPDLQLAVNEAFCNIVVHGKGVNRKSRIVIQVEEEGEELKVEILDQSYGFDPKEVHLPPQPEAKEGGYGLYLMKKLTDRMSYAKKGSFEEWNCLTLYKKERI